MTLPEELEERFTNVPESLRRKLTRIDDPERLRMLLRRAVSVESLTAFEVELDRIN